MTPGTPPAEESTAQRVLWSHIDGQRRPGRLVAGPSDPDQQTGEVVAHLDVFSAGRATRRPLDVYADTADSVDLNRDAVRRLRHACDRLLSAGDVRLTDAQLERAAQLVAERVAAAEEDAARLARQLGPTADPTMDAVLGVLRTLTREVGILASGVGRVP